MKNIGEWAGSAKKGDDVTVIMTVTHASESKGGEGGRRMMGRIAEDDLFVKSILSDGCPKGWKVRHVHHRLAHLQVSESESEWMQCGCVRLSLQCYDADRQTGRQTGRPYQDGFI